MVHLHHSKVRGNICVYKGNCVCACRWLSPVICGLTFCSPPYPRSTALQNYSLGKFQKQVVHLKQCILSLWLLCYCFYLTLPTCLLQLCRRHSWDRNRLFLGLGSKPVLGVHWGPWSVSSDDIDWNVFRGIFINKQVLWFDVVPPAPVPLKCRVIAGSLILISPWVLTASTKMSAHPAPALEWGYQWKASRAWTNTFLLK